MLDVNDCKPVFRSPVMEVYVGEDARVGDLVTTLTSLDQDEDQNAAVSYAFISGKNDFFLYLQRVSTNMYSLVLLSSNIIRLRLEVMTNGVVSQTL